VPAGAAILTTPAPSPAYAAYLAGGETVILALRPSFWFVVIKRAGSLAALAGLWLLMALIERLGWYDFNLAPIGLAFVFIAACVLLWLAVDRASRLYLLTDKRVLRVSGIFSRTSVEIPLHKVTTVVLHRSFTERLVGVGSILFTSAAAGGGGAGGGDLVWYIVDGPASVVGTVRETLARYGGGPTPPGSVGSFGAAQ
jgi:hypothetical protein